MRFFKWKWIFRISGVLALLMCVMPLSMILYVRFQGASHLQQLKDKITAEDPNWQLDDLVKEYNAQLPPDDKNPFFVVEKAHALLPATFNSQTSKLPEIGSRPVYSVMTQSELATHDNLIQSCDPALKVARQLATMPEGGRFLQMPRNPLTAPMTQIQTQRSIAAMMKHDAINHAMHNRPDQAVHSCRCILGVSRSIGPERSLIAQLVRMAIDAIAVGSAEQTLNLTEPKQGLAELQADLQHHAKFNYLNECMRGERAFVHRMFELVNSGEIANTPGGLAGLGLPGGQLALMGLRLNLPADHTFGLNMMNEFVAATKLPTTQQIDAVEKIDNPKKYGVRYVLSALLLPAQNKAFEAAFRNQGKLTAAYVAVACERYRQKFGKWPESLEAIPKDILPEVPTDPCSGKPIIYKRMPNHIIVYSVGPNRIDDGGQLDFVSGQGVPTDQGVRIYDPAMRRQAAPPLPTSPDALPNDPEPDAP